MSMKIGMTNLPFTPATQTQTAAQPGAQSLKAARFTKAATEFESQLLTSLWKSMGSLAQEDEPGADPAGGNVKDMQIQALCSGVAARGGIGIAKMITSHLPILNGGGNQQQTPDLAGKSSAQPADGKN
jgi:Rod binding domain-containing protein